MKRQWFVAPLRPLTEYKLLILNNKLVMLSACSVMNKNKNIKLFEMPNDFTVSLYIEIYRRAFQDNYISYSSDLMPSDSLFAYERVSTQGHRCIGFHDDAFKSSAFDAGCGSAVATRKLKSPFVFNVRTMLCERTSNLSASCFEESLRLNWISICWTILYCLTGTVCVYWSYYISDLNLNLNYKMKMSKT